MKVELYTNNFGGTKLKRNYILGIRGQKSLNRALLDNQVADVGEAESLT
jgi:hypothetical protein